MSSSASHSSTQAIEVTTNPHSIKTPLAASWFPRGDINPGPLRQAPAPEVRDDGDDTYAG